MLAASSSASSIVKLPLICPLPSVMGELITGAEMIAPSSTMAKGRPTFWLVARANLIRPVDASGNEMFGRL